MGDDGTRNRVSDRSSLHRYRTEIPNLIDDMDLSVYAFRLYVKLKRVAGDEGVCCYSTRDLADQCGMGTGSVSRAKQDLVDKDLIRIERDGSSDRDHITIVDLWPANFAHFSRESAPACSPQEQPRSPREHGVPHRNSPVPHGNTIYKEKEEPLKEEPQKEEPQKEEPEGARAQDPIGDVDFWGNGDGSETYKPPPAPYSGAAIDDRVPEGEGNTAVRVYHEVHALHDKRCELNRAARAAIGKAVTDLDLWREVVNAWALQGNKPTNIKGQIDWYKDPARFKADLHARASPNGTSKVDASLSAIDEYERIKAKHGVST